jgi:hypothetical protein
MRKSRYSGEQIIDLSKQWEAGRAYLGFGQGERAHRAAARRVRPRATAERLGVSDAREARRMAQSLSSARR